MDRRLLPTLALAAALAQAPNLGRAEAATLPAAPDPPTIEALATPATGDPLIDMKANLCRGGRGLLPGRQPRQRDYDWDILHADILYAPDFGAQSLSGSVRFECRAEADGLAAVVLDFGDPMTVLAARHDGAPAAHAHVGGQITISLNAALNMGELFEIAVDFAGSPVPTGYGSFEWDTHDGVDLLATLSEPEGARDWWPCKDVPDDKFTADVRYRVPVEFSAPGPGLLQSVTDHGDGTHTWHWHESYPINSYLIAMTVTNYAHYTDWFTSPRGYTLPIENYVFPENYDNSVEDLSLTPLALAIMDSIFGEYPFKNEKYGHAVFQFGGAMEHQTCTSMGSSLLDGDHSHDRIVVHELAHQWFGNAVTLRDWENIWLNEGFARYCDCLWIEYTEGPGGLGSLMTQLTADEHFDGPVYNNPGGMGGFSQTAYNKGAWVLHMLRYLLGDELFFGALNHYYSLHIYDNAHTVDLQADLEAHTGLDLATFFDQWVYGENRPVYEWGWQVDGAPGDRRVYIELHQVQTNAGLFETLVPMVLITSGGRHDLRLTNDQWRQHYTVELGADEPMMMLFDPEEWLLENNSEVPFDPTAAGAAPAYADGLRGNYPNPFNPATRIAFTLAVAGPARLSVHDVKGRLLRVLADGRREAGPQSLHFDGLDGRGRSLPSGVYLAHLRTARGTSTQRMTLLK